MIILPHPRTREAQLREYWRACRTLTGHEPMIGRETALVLLTSAARHEGRLGEAARRRLIEIGDGAERGVK